jgi:DNA-binding transcriptional LysR family regulator
MAELARMGLGLIQAPRYRLSRDLAEGTLVEVLPDTPPSPTPLSVLYPQNRQMSPRLRAFIDWITGVFVEAELR